MTDRPDHVHCIAHTHVDLEGETLCRKSSRMTWCFTSIDHAFNNAVQGGRLLICPECSEVALIALKKGTLGAVDRGSTAEKFPVGCRVRLEKDKSVSKWVGAQQKNETIVLLAGHEFEVVNSGDADPWAEPYVRLNVAGIHELLTDLSGLEVLAQPTPSICYYCDEPNNTGRPCGCTSEVTNE